MQSATSVVNVVIKSQGTVCSVCELAELLCYWVTTALSDCVDSSLHLHTWEVTIGLSIFLLPNKHTSWIDLSLMAIPFVTLSHTARTHGCWIRAVENTTSIKRGIHVGEMDNIQSFSEGKVLIWNSMLSGDQTNGLDVPGILLAIYMSSLFAMGGMQFRHYRLD